MIVMLHWLGGSARSWQEVSEGLAARGMRCVAVDLPGFGQAADSTRISISETVDDLISTICSSRKDHRDSPWFLVGHSMGGKLAAIVTRAAGDGVAGLEDFRGLVLLSPSPPGPEPMDERKREETLKSLGHPTLDDLTNRAHAEKFVDDNTGKLPLLDRVRKRAVDDVLRMNPQALVAWMTTGSKEDWSEHVGIVTTPTLVLSGTEESELGPPAQEKHTLPHFTNSMLAVLDGGGHLAPLERPLEIVDRMTEFFLGLDSTHFPATSSLRPEFSALIASNRTSSQTREALMDRLNIEFPTATVLSADERRLLRAVAERVIPHAGFDIAARLETALAQNTHDGWRFNTLPKDEDTWKGGLRSLDAAAKREFAVPFIALDPARQDDLLTRAQRGDLCKGLRASPHLGESAPSLDATQMQDWFQDVRGELVKIYIAHPRTMERIGFTGFADEEGFTQIKLSEREEFEN